MPVHATPVSKLLPKLYIYDRSPFCVRARMIFGLKNVEHELVFLANHDERTPFALVGKKTTPILQLASGEAFAESLNIVRYVDEHFGGGSVLVKEVSGREDLKQWHQRLRMPQLMLMLPRVSKVPFAEFAQRASRDYFVAAKEAEFGSLDALQARTPEFLAAVNASLEELEELIHSETAVNANGLSYDDIELFGALRGLTLVKGIAWPTKVRAYVDYMAAAADVPLLFSMATA